jgi:Domain of unknown function (DUF1906)/Repeat of unknown function (DUF346)
MPKVLCSRLTRGVLVAAATAVVAAAGSTAAAASTAGTGSLRQISYQGYKFEVPASWPVNNLATDPNACVRFDRHEVYLGTPGANEACRSAKPDQTTEAVLIQPEASTGAAKTVRDPVTDTITVTAPRIKLTATYGTDEAQVLQILASASLPAPVSATPKPSRTPPVVPQTATGSTASIRASLDRDQAAVVTAAPTLTAAPAAISPSATAFTGKGFDPCTAPSAANMSAWRTASPYRAVGVYIGGSERACAQPNLTAGWVRSEAAAGWHFWPLWVGPQAEFSQLTSPAAQGTSNAEGAVAAAESLGFPAGTPIIYDMESYSHSQESAGSVLTFIAAWTNELHKLGYRSGEYSSSSSGITDLVDNFTHFTMPDVIDDALWNGVANTADPVIPSTEWADHQRIHQYLGGVNQTFGGFTLNIDADFLDVGASTSAAASAGRPVLNDPATGNLEIYATGSNGALEQKFWNSSKGWSSWVNLGGSITGTPSALYDPASGRLEVYARGAGGALFQKSWSAKTGWSTWINLGGSLAGSPAAIYDQASGHLEVYATGTNGALEQKSWKPSTGWSGWINLSGSITGTPSPVYDPASGNLEVYVRGAAGSAFEKYWSPKSGWGKWHDMGGSVTGSPAAIYDPASGNLEVYATKSGGTLEQIAWNPRNGWSGWRSLSGSITGDPSPAYDSANNSINVFVRGAGGPVFQRSWSPTSGWSGWVDTGGKVTGDPAGLYDTASRNLEVYAVSSAGALFQASRSGSTWSSRSLGGTLDGL